MHYSRALFMWSDQRSRILLNLHVSSLKMANIQALLEHVQRTLGQAPSSGAGPSTLLPLLVTSGGTTLAQGAGHAGGGNAVSSIPTTGSHTAQVTSNPQLQVLYTYKVRIINPTRKSEVCVRSLNDYSAKFDTVTALRVKLIDTFQDSVPNTMDFSVGYFEGSQKSKVSLVVSEDLKTMYNYFPRGGPITLWCDGRYEDDPPTRKRKKDTETSKRSVIQEKECEVDDVYKTLLEKHSQKWDIPRLRLWARLICSDQHQSYEEPPDLPAFKEPQPKKRRESLSDALTGAAVAFAQAVSPTPTRSDMCPQQGVIGHGVSPGKVVDLRMKNFEQLRYLQKLYEDRILSEAEYNEQKRNILDFLHDNC